MNQFTALTMPYSACQQASQDLFDDAVRLERIFLRTGFHRQRCRHIGFTDDFVTKRNNK
jgi:hypothetical protein